MGNCCCSLAGGGSHHHPHVVRTLPPQPSGGTITEPTTATSSAKTAEIEIDSEPTFRILRYVKLAA